MLKVINAAFASNYSSSFMSFISANFPSCVDSKVVPVHLWKRCLEKTAEQFFLGLLGLHASNTAN